MSILAALVSGSGRAPTRAERVMARVDRLFLVAWCVAGLYVALVGGGFLTALLVTPDEHDFPPGAWVGFGGVVYVAWLALRIAINALVGFAMRLVVAGLRWLLA